MSEILNTTTADVATPIPEGQPIPNRKVIRGWLLPLSEKTTLRGIILLLVDLLIWTALIIGTVLVENIFLKVLLGLVAGFWIGRLFILGHDACHMSYTPHKELNKWLGRIAFLVSITPYSLWEVGHNVVHHGQTNLKGFDFVWAPLSLEEYQALPAWRKTLERIYRSGWGPVLYYMIEIWWLKMFFPSKKRMPSNRKIFLWDNLLVSAFGILWMAALTWAALATAQSIWITLLCGFVIPFLFWNGMIGFVVYVHHTHPSTAWYDNKSEWLRAQPFVSTTVHLTFKYHFGALVHHIMEHTAHHVDMGVPLYRLKKAQAKLEELLPGRVIVQAFSWGWYFKTAEQCKLYDFKNKAWLDFNGNKTADSVRVVLSPA